MAFYNPSFYRTDLAHYDSCYDSAQTEPQISQSSNEPSFYNLFDYPANPAYDSGGAYNAPYTSNFNEPQLIEYHPVDHGAYGFPVTYSANPCSASTYSVPNKVMIEYDPDFYGYQNVSTQFVISNSVAEFNETEFEEYDPTPYDGGYDISETYGKPLQPSIEICYPPSSSSSPPKPPPPAPNDAIGGSKGSIEPQKGKEEISKEPTKPSGEIKATQIQEDNDSSSGESDTASEAEDMKAITWADPGSGYENGRAVNQFPSGYGLEAMDLCETLFGYWPCLSRIKKQTDCRRHNNGCAHCHGNRNNQWETAADYLFGSHYPYPDERGQGHPVHAYQFHYQGQGEPLYGHALLNNFNHSEDL